MSHLLFKVFCIWVVSYGLVVFHINKKDNINIKESIKDNMINKSHNDFFIVLGYLSSPIRNTKLDIETALSTQASVQSKYLILSGNQLNLGKNFYQWPSGTNKWGSELRIYFNSNSNIPLSLKSMVVRPRYNPGNYNARVNNNGFVWDLIEYGFTASDSQSVMRISSRVPQSRLNEFNAGLKL